MVTNGVATQALPGRKSHMRPAGADSGRAGSGIRSFPGRPRHAPGRAAEPSRKPVPQQRVVRLCTTADFAPVTLRSPLTMTFPSNITYKLAAPGPI